MATDQYYSCQCAHRQRIFSQLFDALRNIANSQKPECNKCGMAKELDLTFHFSRKGGDPECRVLAVYSPIPPAPSWDDAGETITFHPFLVILDDRDEGPRVWLPYWHTKEKEGKTRRMYGQFAPFLSHGALKNLLAQAHRDGYLTDLKAA